MGSKPPEPETSHEEKSPQQAARRFGLGHRVSAVLLAAAAALAGGITTERASMISDSSGGDREDTAEFGGFLPIQEDEAELALGPYEDPELLEDVPVGEDEVSDEVEGVLDSAEVIETLGESGIPEVAIEAYTGSEDVQADADPGCGLRWTLLAAIGRVESDHGRFGGAQLREDGYGTKPIRGIPLDGRPNVALIRDTDNGELDGDTTYDRAVGPMQFIPSTWSSVGQDGNDDGRRDPDNIFDAAQGAGAYLCADDANLNNTAGRARAVRRYNNADEYVRVVLSLATMYETGRVEPLPDLPVPPGAATPSGPPPQSPATPRPGTPPASPPAAGPGTPTSPATPAPASPAPTTTPPTTAPSQPAAPPPAAPPTTAPAQPVPTTAPTPAAPAQPTPPITAPAEPAPATPTTTAPTQPGPPAPADPPAAVGWAPAMREVVVDILTDDAACAQDQAAAPDAAGCGGPQGGTAPVPAPAPAESPPPPEPGVIEEPEPAPDG
jgi:hypothetical protein